MHMLDVELRHYYNTYSNIDTLKLGILMQIKLMQLDNYEIDIKDRKIQLNGNDIANYDNIPIFHGNDEITHFRGILDTLTEKYYDIHRRYLENPDDMNIYSDYVKITAERDKVINQLRGAEKRVLRLTEKIFSTESQDELSQRQREGYRMLERGDYESALKVLDLNEIYSEIEHNEMIEDNVRKRLQINVNELLQRIETLEAKGITPVTIAEIKNIYGQACALVQKHNLDKAVLYFYASFLFNQRDYESAINMINLLISQYSNSDEELSERQISLIHGMLGILYSETNEMKAAEKHYLKAIEIQDKLSSDNPVEYAPILAASYHNLGNIYMKTNKSEYAEPYLEQAVRLQEIFYNINQKDFEADFALIYGSLANAYKDNKKFEKAEEIYLKVIEIEKRLCVYNPQRFEGRLARTYDNIASLYGITSREDEAEKYYLKAIEIQIRICLDNPGAYEPDLAHSYFQLGYLYYSKRKIQEAEEAYLKNIRILEKLCFSNLKAFGCELSISYNAIAILYSTTYSISDGEKFFLKSIELLEKLYKINPEFYKPYLASSYNNLGALYSDARRINEAEDAYLKSIEIKMSLCKDTPEVFEPSLADSYTNLGLMHLHSTKNNVSKQNLLKAAEIYERLNETTNGAYTEKLKNIRTILKRFDN